jgi:hypothetical protein
MKHEAKASVKDSGIEPERQEKVFDQMALHVGRCVRGDKLLRRVI